MAVRESRRRWFGSAPAERPEGNDTRLKAPLSYWSPIYGQFFSADWEEFRKKQKQHAWRLEQYLGDDEVPWLAAACGGHFDRGSFAATSESLIFIPKTHKPEEAKSLGQRYLVHRITDLAQDRGCIVFAYEGAVVKIPFPEAFWPLVLKFPGIVAGAVVVQSDELQAATAAGRTKQLSVGCLAGTTKEAVGSALMARGSASYAKTVHEVVFRAPTDAAYYQKLVCPVCGTELWVQVESGEPELRRFLPERGLMCDAEGVEEVVAATSAVAGAAVKFPRHKVLDRRGRPGFDKAIWLAPTALKTSGPAAGAP